VISTTDYTQTTKNIWFPDQQEPFLDKNDEASVVRYKNYWKRELHRLREGFYLADGQVFISGFLYWHTVYWKIAMYVEDKKTGRKPRIIDTPWLRDVDWDIAGDFVQCDLQGKFYNLVGSRDFGKSIIAASRAGWQYTLFDNSESVISGGAATYIKLATDKIEDGLTNLHPMLKKQRLMSDWKKEVRAGWKEKTTNLAHPKSSNSRILVRNYQDGTNTMAANGTRPGFHLIDEEGTIPNLIGCIKDSDGCWWSGGGNKPSCLVMLAGTGGDMERGKEAAEVFNDPYSYNILEFDNPEEIGKKMGRFISALRAKMAYKEPMPLSKYLGISHPDLDKITILVSNEEKALKEWWNPEYDKAKSSGNSKTILKFRAYWPLVPSDSFLIVNGNIYNTDIVKEQIKKLHKLGKTGTYVRLIHNGEKITHEFTEKVPITQFPVKDQDKDAPVVIYEWPAENPPTNLYVAGVDSYRDADAKSSDSLGAVYILKRTHSLVGERYENMIVASYVARPNKKDDWNEQARLLIKMYNARTLVENDEISFIEYMKRKNDTHYLEPQPAWLKEIVPNTTVTKEFGIHRSSERVRDFLNGCYKRYMEEVIYQKKDEQGSIIGEILGVARIFDPMLLEETLKFNDEDNFDRIIAASLAFAMAEALDGKVGKITSSTDPRIAGLYKHSKGGVTFAIVGGKQKTTIIIPSNKRQKPRLKLFT
jgi:hypothetical protein